MAGISVVAILTVFLAPEHIPRTTSLTSLTFTATGKPTFVLTIPKRKQRFDDIGAAVAAFQEEVKKEPH
jgi:hypothetical protein